MNLFCPSRPGRRVLRRVVVAVALAGLVAGCGTDTGSDAPSGPGTTGAVVDLTGSWHLVEGADAAGALPTDTGQDITLRVEGAEAGGVSACNHYTATVSVEGSAASFTGLGGTEMACAPAVMELERRYLIALGATQKADRSGDTLTLTGDGTLTFSLDPPTADARLTRTVWRLESLVDGESVSSTEPGGLLVLSDDGTWRASTGCGDLRGGYRLSGSTVTVTDRRTQPMADGACSEPALAQHAHVSGVLSGSFEVAVEGDRLRVTAPDGRGLDYRAP